MIAFISTDCTRESEGFSCLKIMGKHINRVGENHTTNEGFKLKIIYWKNCESCTIQFEDRTVLENINYFSILKGHVKNPNHKSIYGVAKIGVGKYNSKNSKESFKRWKGILTRGYCKTYKERQPTYKDVTVCEEWHNFQNFAQWFEDNYKSHMEGWQLDKDILVKGNKIYSPETCCFVPREINNMITRTEKEIHVFKKDGKYYPQVSLKKKNKNLKPVNSKKEAVDLIIEVKKEYMSNILNKYLTQIEPKVLEKLKIIIEKYTRF